MLSLLSLGLPATAGVDDTCVLSKNYANAQYTVPVHVGTPSQVLNAVPDTGSFELMMTSTECEGCDGHVQFNSRNSSSFINLGTVVDTKFGQGDVSSAVNYDRVQLGDLYAPKQSILLMQQNKLRNFKEAAYDAVMGMGRETKARYYSDDLSLMASLKAPVTGVCIGQHDQEPGRLQVGAEVPGLSYVTLPVVGTTHWGINIDGVSLTAQPGAGKADVAIPGCAASGCQAIVDSGTSLMALPKVILNQVLDKIGHIEPDCSNVDQLPNVRFSAGGHHFDLPPQLYVAKMENDDGSSRAALATSLASPLSPGADLPVFKMPWQHRTIKLDATASTSCVPLFMEMDIATSFNGPAMIFGLPFLRRYAARFDRTAQTVALGEIPLGSSLCTHCGDSHGASAPSALLAGSISLAATPSSQPPADAPAGLGVLQPKADVGLMLARERPVLRRKHLRMPSWMHRVTRHPVTGQHTISL